MELLMTTTTTSSLYCAEDAGDLATWDASDDWTPEALLLHSDEGPILTLLSNEHAFMPSSDYLLSLINPTPRHDAVSWILKVSELYHFQPVTACLAVNYLDRFLSSHSIPDVQGQTGKGGGWPLQLLAVACVSVAAKMEETHVPLLLDLQVLEPRFVFEPRTIRRMELLLMAALRWRMRAITPFDFLDAASSALPPAARRRCAELILETSRVVDFLGFPPSVIAGAAIVCAGREIGDSSSVEDADLLRFLGDSVCLETVRGCRQLMDEYLIDTCPSLGGKPCSEPITPQSPSGVLDAAECGGCSSDKSSSSATQAEPPSKRRRIGHR